MPKLAGESGRPVRRRPPATTPEEREDQLISLAVRLAEQKLADGTASNQIIVHFLQKGSAKERLERKKLEMETELLVAKADQINSSKRSEETYAKAIEAMRSYSGSIQQEYDDREED